MNPFKNLVFYSKIIQTSFNQILNKLQANWQQLQEIQRCANSGKTKLIIRLIT
jgi:hypothetical protein